MSGILSGKERILDTILTQEGRSQLASGRLKATYVSFTDSSAIYNMDTIVSGGLQANNRFVLEAGNLTQDQVTMEANDAGLIQAFATTGSEQYTIRQGQILSTSLDGVQVPVTGSQFNSMAGELLSSSINNFTNLYILKSPDPLDSKEKVFTVSATNTTFTVSDDKPFSSNDVKEACVDQIESFFYDKRLSHISNFMFLPPVNSVAESGNDIATPLGSFVDLNQMPIVTFDDAVKELNEAYKQGYGSTIYFTETSKLNNLACQFFELQNGQMSKLDVIDFGEFNTQTGTKHIFYAGKVFTDSYGAQTFVTLFTLMFE